jgi:hypothetical protein
VSVGRVFRTCFGREPDATLSSFRQVIGVSVARSLVLCVLPYLKKTWLIRFLSSYSGGPLEKGLRRVVSDARLGSLLIHVRLSLQNAFLCELRLTRMALTERREDPRASSLQHGASCLPQGFQDGREVMGPPSGLSDRYRGISTESVPLLSSRRLFSSSGLTFLPVHSLQWLSVSSSTTTCPRIRSSSSPSSSPLRPSRLSGERSLLCA